ncbi:MAG: NAD(P)/FAD-dependent oxidoreductase [Anaerolineae bacterium]
MESQANGNRVLVLGASWAGAFCAPALHDTARKLGAPMPQITVVDRNNFILNTALLPEIISNSLNPLSIVPSLRRLWGKRDINFVQAEILSIDVNAKRVTTSAGDLEYDSLVLALGGQTNYFNNPSFEKYGWPYKVMADAIRLRNHVIECLERANAAEDLAEKRRLLTFVQAGAGACGLEVFTELSELLHHVCGKTYRNVSMHRDVRMILADGLPRVLAGMPQTCADAACEKLTKKGVDIRLNTFISAAGPGWVELAGGERIETETLIWVAGTKAVPLIAGIPCEHDRAGRIKVDEFHRVPGLDGVYAVGDAAHFVGDDGQPLGTTAQTAVQQGPNLGRNLVRESLGQPPKPYHYHYRGDLVSIGTLDSVTTPFGREVRGPLGWLVFKWVYFWKTPTMQNRFRILTDWVLHYLTGPMVASLELKAGISPLDYAQEEKAVAEKA